MGLYEVQCNETFGAYLTRRQWRLIVSALSESEHKESEELAKSLLFFVLPPNFKNAKHTTNDCDTD